MWWVNWIVCLVVRLEIGITEYFVDGGIMLLLESVVCVAR